MGELIVTENTLVAHSLCIRKSYQVLFCYGSGGNPEYAEFLEKREKEHEEAYFESCNNSRSFLSDKLIGKADAIMNAKLTVGNLVVQQVHLQKCETKSNLGDYSYVPLIFSVSRKISMQEISCTKEETKFNFVKAVFKMGWQSRGVIYLSFFRRTYY